MILLHVLEFRINNAEMEFCDDIGNVNMFTSSINLSFMIVEIYMYIPPLSLSLSLSLYIYIYIYTHTHTHTHTHTYWDREYVFDSV